MQARCQSTLQKDLSALSASHNPVSTLHASRKGKCRKFSRAFFTEVHRGKSRQYVPRRHCLPTVPDEAESRRRYLCQSVRLERRPSTVLDCPRDIFCLETFMF